MKTIKIAKKTNEVISTAPLNFISGGTSGNDLYIVVEKKYGLDLNEGGKLIFEKNASGNSGEMLKVYEESTKIKKIVANGDYFYVYFEYVYIIPLTLASYRKIETTEGYNYKLYFTGDHHMLPCDFDLNKDYKVYIRRGNNVIEFSGLALCFPGELVKGENKEPIGTECCDEDTLRFNFETMERNSILAKSMSVPNFTPEPGDEVFFATNPFFHIIDTGGTMNLYNCPPGETVSILKYTDFLGVGATLEQSYDAKKMFQEYQVNELFVDKIKESIIPGIIDLEKVKYAPAFLEKDAFGDPNKACLATGLTFNLHFRTRVSGATDVKGDVAKYTFEDTWHFNNDTVTWNGNGVEQEGTAKEREDLYIDSGFVNSSNLIGYLGFTDDDIYNQKNKVKQTFLRLSFYDSNDPLTQNLLYYSTIFLDSGDLFGKYVKRKAWLEDFYKETKNEEYNPEKYPVVWSSASTDDPCDAVTSQLIVNDEYDITRSGEGFNIYLFRQDAPIENSPQTIYMKIEFNHAGYGRTVPLIYWPKESEKGPAKKLTMGNYIGDALYTPVQISLSDRGYVYSFPNAVSADDEDNGGRCNGIVWENERIVLNLFEPMIEPEKDQ